MPYTDQGLPYPGPQDKLKDTAWFIRELAAATDYRLGNRDYAVWYGLINCDASGFTSPPLNFPTLASVKGAVIIPVGDGYSIYSRIQSMAGTTVTAQFAYCQISTAGTATVPYAGPINVGVFAWGVAK